MGSATPRVYTPTAMPHEKSMANHEMLLNSGFSSALPSLILPYLEKAT
jgi:hypothetical protein